MESAKFHELLVRLAHEEDLPLAGGVDLDRTLGPDGRFFEHLEKYDYWLSQGMHGAMEYLQRGRDRRADPRAVFPAARSVFSVAQPYRRAPAGETRAANGARYARYIDGPDYHDTIAEKLERVMTRAKAESGDDSLSWKVCVDTSAILERTWAALAGLGWIGKNTLLLHPRLGSYLFLGEVLLSRETGMGPRPLADLCGHCERCLQACPTGAFTAPRTLDSRRCISYWTLEKRGELAIPEEQKASFGTWLAGCDLCQEACPFNLKPAREADAIPESSSSDLRRWEELLAETPEGYRARVKNSALSRVKPAQFSRNLAVAIRNSLEELPQSLDRRIVERLSSEADPVARAEWELTVRKAESRKRRPDTKPRTEI